MPIATDVHTIANLDDPYNRDFMAAATLLAMSDEHLPVDPESWVRRLVNRYGTEIVLVGLGSQGCLLWVKRDNFLERVPAVRTRPVVNTIGAGDALFSSFLHFYAKTGDPYAAVQRAVHFASYKIGETGAAAGFLPEAGVAALLENNLIHEAHEAHEGHEALMAFLRVSPCVSVCLRGSRKPEDSDPRRHGGFLT